MRTRRPALAALLAVLLIAGTVVVWFATRPKPIPPPAVEGPDVVVRVTTTFPGANAQTVAETVAAPIERELHTAEGVTRLESESWEDGSYTLTVRLAAGTDPDAAVTVVQNRVNVALPQLPDEVRRQGVRVRKAADGPPVVWVSVTSEHRAILELSVITRQLVVPALEALPGVADVQLVGGKTGVLVVGLDPDRLAARGLSIQDVTAALARQNVQVAAGPESQLTLITLGHLPRMGELEEVVVKSDEGGRVVYLRDVAVVAEGVKSSGWGLLDGRLVVLVGITRWGTEPTADAVRAALAGVKQMPEGVTAEVVADATDGRMLSVEMVLPDGARVERTLEAVARARMIVVTLPGVAGSVAFGERRQPNVATLFVNRTANQPTAAEVRKRLAEELPEAVCRVSEAVAGREPFPVRVALYDPNGLGEQSVRRSGENVANRWRADPGVTDVLAAHTNTVTRTEIELDGTKAAALGVSADDVFAAVSATGARRVNRINGRWTVRVQDRFRQEDLKLLRVRTQTGEVVPLSAVVSVRTFEAPPVIVRVDRHMAVIVSANPTDGNAPATAARLLKDTALELTSGVQAIDLTRPR